MTLAQRAVGELLERSGLSKAEFARRAEVSRALVDDYLKGTRQPSVGQLERLGERLGLSLQVGWSAPRRAAGAPTWTRAQPSMQPTPLTMAERGEALERVVPVAMELRRRVRGPLEFPPFRSLGRPC